MSKDNKWKSNIKYGDRVYFIDDYIGISQGVVASIMDRYKPVKYRIISNGKIYDILPTRVFQDEYSAKQQQRSYLKTGFKCLCDKLNMNVEDALFVLKVFKIEQKYSNEQLNKLLNKRVKIVVNGDTIEGTLKFMKNYTDDSICQSFYYIDEPIGDFYGSNVRQSFQAYNIDKIEQI